MEKLYISVQNGTKPYINKKGEVVIDLSPKKATIGRKEIELEPLDYRVVHSYMSNGEERFRISDRGFFKVDKDHVLHISRKTEGKL